MKIKKTIYIISYAGHLCIILISSFIICIYTEPLLRLIGFSPSINPNLILLWLSVGMAIASLEILFRALLQLIFSAPFNQTNLIEAVSFLPFTLLLVGDFLLSYFNINLPPLLKSLLLMLVVIFLHMGMKLLSIFSATFGNPNSRLLSLLWLIPFLLSIYTSIVGVINLISANFTERLFPIEMKLDSLEKKTMSSNFPEGRFILTHITKANCKELTLHLKAGENLNANTLVFIYIFTLNDKTHPIYKEQITISSSSEWQELSIPCDYFLPENTLIITWSSYKLPSWLIKKGFIPTISFTSYLELKSFIFNHQPYTSTKRKSLVIFGPHEVIDCGE